MSKTLFKNIVKTVASRKQNDGAGATVYRSIGTESLRYFDPFIMLDEFDVPRGAGFPDHPHRGFETVTYMLDGSFEHEDFTGTRGLIGPGDLQWMTAGRGIVHAEMPYFKNGAERPHGLQLWVNLPAKHKMMEPRYQEFPASKVPLASSADGGVRVKVIAGESLGVKAPVHTMTPIYYLDVTMDPNQTFEQDIPESFNVFLYTLEGKVYLESTDADIGKASDPHCTIVMGHEGTKIRAKTSSSTGAKFVIIAGEPINEPIVQHGPFVMNTKDEIMQAFMDYQMGRNGFERAARWQSEIGKSLMG